MPVNIDHLPYFCRYTFRWLFIPWLQVELDSYVYRRNFSSKRADKNKILPHGPPDEIYNYPENYDCRNFRVSLWKH